MPQSHISKIERGAVDLQLSSLIELARVLDLDIMSVPAKTGSRSPGRRSEARTIVPSRQSEKTQRAVNELKRIQDTAQRLDFADKDIKQWQRFQQTVNDFANLRLNGKDIQQIHTISETLRKLKKGPKAYEEFLNTVNKLHRLRSTLAHRPSDLISLPAVRPAYTLDEGDNA